jgi:hypothetical protein
MSIVDTVKSGTQPVVQEYLRTRENPLRDLYHISERCKTATSGSIPSSAREPPTWTETTAPYFTSPEGHFHYLDRPRVTGPDAMTTLRSLHKHLAQS